MLVVEPMGTLAGQDMGCHESDILNLLAPGGNDRKYLSLPYPKSNRSKFVVFSNWERQQTLGLSLLRVEEQVFGIETGAGMKGQFSCFQQQILTQLTE